MGCVVSKLEDEDDVVSCCKERKRLMKSAVERRYALADAHCKYSHSLYAVAAALRLFVARHSFQSSSPYLITFPPPCPDYPPSNTTITNPLFLQQRPFKSTQETFVCHNSSGSSVSSDCSEVERDDVVGEGEKVVVVVEENEEEEAKERGVRMVNEQAFGCFYTGMPPPMPSPQRDFGWDFFNPFDGMRPEVLGGFGRNSDDDLRVVREEEGIPELEEVEERERGDGKVAMVSENDDGAEKGAEQVPAEDDDDDEEEEEEEEEKNGVEVMKAMDVRNVSQREQQGLAVLDTPVRGRELLEALKDIQDHFIRAYDSGKEVSKMLEVNRVNLQSGLEEIKENSTKLIQSITWHRATLSQSSSCKSFLASSSKSSTWTEFKNDLFDDCGGGMDSGSHSSTLGRLYAWEKKLYEEVKAGDRTRKMYEKKCSQLKNRDVRVDDVRTMDKTRSTVRDLYTQILVAIRTAESISKRIEKLRDDELQPQIFELIKGLSRTWQIMFESHETQNKIMLEVQSYTCPSYGRFCNNSHRLATLQLEAEIDNWQACFAEYFSAQKAYLDALYGWLSKFISPEVKYCSQSRSSIPSYRVAGPPLLMICQEWLSLLEKLPDKGVVHSMKSFSKDVKALWIQQGEEQQQKRKVDILTKDLDRRVHSFQRMENRILEPKLLDQKAELDLQERVGYLEERKDLLETFRKRLENEKGKHHNCMQETQRMTLSGFQTGLSSLFQLLTEFSKATIKMFDDLVQYVEKEKVIRDGKSGNPSYIEASCEHDKGGGG